MELEKNADFTKTVREKKKLWMFLLFFMLMAIIILLSALLLKKPTEPQTQLQSGMREANAMIGQFVGKTEEEIQEELDRVVEKGMFHISINPEIVMETGGSEADIRVENVPGNQYLMRVTITLDSTEEVIYTSGLIEPNYYVQKVTLDKVLPKGTHQATALFTAYNLETEIEAGTAAAKITISVKD